MSHPTTVQGLISQKVGKLLTTLASRVPSGQIVVEIGAYMGRSTCYLAEGVKDGVRVVSIDPHGLAGSERGRGGRFAGDKVRNEYLKNIAPYGDKVEPIHALSCEAPIPHEEIGLLWIDGAHDLINIAGDVYLWGNRVAPGGYVVIDDCRTWHPGVDAVVKAMRNDPRWEDWRFDPDPLSWCRRAKS